MTIAALLLKKLAIFFRYVTNILSAPLSVYRCPVQLNAQGTGLLLLAIIGTLVVCQRKRIMRIYRRIKLKRANKKTERVVREHGSMHSQASTVSDSSVASNPLRRTSSRETKSRRQRRRRVKKNGRIAKSRRPIDSYETRKHRRRPSISSDGDSDTSQESYHSESKDSRASRTPKEKWTVSPMFRFGQQQSHRQGEKQIRGQSTGVFGIKT